MTGTKTKKKNLADPGSGLWLSYSIDRAPSHSVLKRFDPAPEERPQSSVTPAVRERIFNEELRGVTSDVLTHRPGVAVQSPPPTVQKIEPAAPPGPIPAAAPTSPVRPVPVPVAEPVVPPPSVAPAPAPAASPGATSVETGPAAPQQTPAPNDPEPEIITQPVAETPAAKIDKTPEARAQPDPAPAPEAEKQTVTEEPAAPTVSPPGEAPDLFVFPDKLDDAEEIRTAGGDGARHAATIIEDSQSDFQFTESDLDEIELEDPPDHGPFRRPEPVATDLSVRNVPADKPDQAPERSTEPARQPAATQSGLEAVAAPVATEIEMKVEAEARSATESEVGRSAVSFRSHEAHSRQAAEARSREATTGFDPDLPDAPAAREVPLDQAAPQALPVERIAANFKQADYAYPEEFVDLFKNLYSSRQLKAEQLKPVLEFLLKKSGAHAIAWLVLDRRLSAFRPFMDMHLDVNTRKNLYFSLKDKYLPDEEMYEVLRFNGNLKQDFHFRKRFSTPFLLGHKGAVIINLNVLQQSSYIMLFYKRLPPDNIVEELDRSSLPVIRDLLPAVQRIQEEAESGLRSSTNFADLLYHSVREMTHFGKTPLRVLHFQFPGILQKSSRSLLMEKLTVALKQHLLKEERILCLLPGRLVVLLYKTDEAVVTEIVRDLCFRWGLETETTSYRFPDRGLNLYNYLEPRRKK